MDYLTNQGESADREGAGVQYFFRGDLQTWYLLFAVEPVLLIVSLWHSKPSRTTLSSIPSLFLRVCPILTIASCGFASHNHIEILSPLFRTLTTAPLTRTLSPSNDSPIKQSITSNQKLSKHDARCFLSRFISHRPPFLFLSSSHIGLIPSLNKE